MFAVLVIEREPLHWSQLPVAIGDWAKGAGAVAAFALALWCLAYFLTRRFSVRVAGVEITPQDTHPALRGGGWTTTAALFAAATALSAASYIALLLLLIAVGVSIPLGAWTTSAADVLLTAGGGFALIAVLVPIVMELGRFSGRRIWALARLSLKEAIRLRILWAIVGINAVFFLFAAWFLPSKPEDQLRNYVLAIYLVLLLLFLLVAIWLGSFGIPTEVKNQSIHTIVTKPVERFEIVVGRFLGYGVLLTGAMFLMAAFSLLYLVRGVREESKKESYTARVPLFADKLSYKGPGLKEDKGENVGRVWDYRGYIGGAHPSMPTQERQYAIWAFNQLPTLFDDPSVPIYFEFSFDIFRLTKGKENRGVNANFVFADGRLSVPEVERDLDKLEKDRRKHADAVAKQANEKRKNHEPEAKIQDWQSQQLRQIDAEMIAKYGIYATTNEVIDYHTQALGGSQRDEVAGQLALLFQRLRELERERPRQAVDDQPAPPALHVFVSVDKQSESAAQRLGMAKYDLYVLAAEGPFWANYFKGVIGMWFVVLLILGIAVACSTYFSGIISLLVTIFLLLMGASKDNLVELAQAKRAGPFESLWRLANKAPEALRMEEGATKDIVSGLDVGYRFLVRLVLNVFPDISRYDLHHYVANGFNISWTQVLFLDNLVPLVGYVLPCAVLAFYLMKFREVANPS